MEKNLAKLMGVRNNQYRNASTDHAVTAARILRVNLGAPAAIASIRPADDAGLSYFVTGPTEDLKARHGDWLVKDNATGDLAIISHANFGAAYQPLVAA